MVCNRCLKVIHQELQQLGVTVLSLELGRLLVEAPKKNNNEIVNAVTTVLHANDFEIVENEEEMLVERIKIILIEQRRGLLPEQRFVVRPIEESITDHPVMVGRCCRTKGCLCGTRESRKDRLQRLQFQARDLHVRL